MSPKGKLISVLMEFSQGAPQVLILVCPGSVGFSLGLMAQVQFHGLYRSVRKTSHLGHALSQGAPQVPILVMSRVCWVLFRPHCTKQLCVLYRSVKKTSCSLWVMLCFRGAMCALTFHYWLHPLFPQASVRLTKGLTPDIDTWVAFPPQGPPPTLPTLPQTSSQPEVFLSSCSCKLTSQ